MESLQGVSNRSWIDQEKINIKLFLKEWENQQIKDELSINNQNLPETAVRSLSLDEGLLENLEKDTDIKKFSIPEDEDLSIYSYGNHFDIPTDLNLKTLALQKEHLERCKNNISYRSEVVRNLRNRNQRFQVAWKQGVDHETPYANDGLECLLSVQVFRPMRSHDSWSTYRYPYRHLHDQEFQVIGRQFLTSLKDVISCISDINIHDDFSDKPEMAQNYVASDIYSSSFFFINDCFYNDMRNSDNIDYSRIIRRWAKEEGRGIGELSCALMEETRFNDLTIRLGLPYLYLHQGDCEHMIVFTDLRILKPDMDSLNIYDYPKIIQTSDRTATRCKVCNLKTAKWVVRQNKRLPDEFTLFCDLCFYSFNYDENKCKIGSFEAYPYLDKSALL